MSTAQNDISRFRALLCRAALGGADRLAAYGEGALAPSMAARVERHLSACPACREELAALRALSALLLARRPAAPAPAEDLWRRIQAEIETVPAPAPLCVARRSFLVPALSTAACAALAAVAVLTNGRPGSENSVQSASGTGAARVADAAPSGVTATPIPLFRSGASSLAARTGLQVAKASSSLVPQKRVAVARPPQTRVASSAVEDPFVPLQNRASRRSRVAKNNRRRDRGGLTLEPKTVLSLVQPGSGQAATPKQPAPEGTPLDETGGTTTIVMTPLAPGGEESPAAAASSSPASLEDPSGPSPTLTAARSVAASDSAVTRYLSDNRRSGLFRYASSVVSSAPSQPDDLR